jgi:hypothetical protein
MFVLKFPLKTTDVAGGFAGVDGLTGVVEFALVAGAV